MVDERYRSLERRARQGDLEAQVRELAERVRLGSISSADVALAAAIGDKASALVVGKPWTSVDLPTILQLLFESHEQAYVSVMRRLASLVLPHVRKKDSLQYLLNRLAPHEAGDEVTLPALRSWLRRVGVWIKGGEIYGRFGADISTDDETGLAYEVLDKIAFVMEPLGDASISEDMRPAFRKHLSEYAADFLDSTKEYPSVEAAAQAVVEIAREAALAVLLPK